MSTRFEHSLILPRPGKASLLLLPQDDRASVLRWHRKEWEQFVDDWKAAESKRVVAIYDASRRAFSSKRKQRGSIILSAFGVQTGAASEVVTLSGTSGVPNVSFDKEESPTSALAGWRWNADGTIDRVASDVWTAFNSGTEWIDSNPTPAGNYWVQATLDSGDAPTSGPALTTFHALTSTREWTWLESSDPPGSASTLGTLQIDISDESDGTPILDTGYYRGTASQNGTA